MGWSRGRVGQELGPGGCEIWGLGGSCGLVVWYFGGVVSVVFSLFGFGGGYFGCLDFVVCSCGG